MKFVLFLLTIPNVWSAIPNCAPGVACPPGGMWGEWTSVGDGVCKMECGACAQLFQIRQCLSSEISGCSCVGIDLRHIPCNMNQCPYPSQRTCCIPYLPIITNGNPTCGPLPKTMKEPETRCCPINGIWSQWTSSYAKINSQWVRTRRCLSDSIGCSCVGNEIDGDSNCPCRDLPSAAIACSTVSVGKFGEYQKPYVKITDCTASVIILGNNDNDKIHCEPYTNDYRSYQYVSLLIMEEMDGKCTFDRPFDCANEQRLNESTNVTFSCNMDTGNWIYDYSGKDIKSYAIGYYFVD